MGKLDLEREANQLLQTARSVRRAAERRRHLVDDDREITLIDNVIWLTRKWEETAFTSKE